MHIIFSCIVQAAVYDPLLTIIINFFKNYVSLSTHDGAFCTFKKHPVWSDLRICSFFLTFKIFLYLKFLWSSQNGEAKMRIVVLNR